MEEPNRLDPGKMRTARQASSLFAALTAMTLLFSLAGSAASTFTDVSGPHAENIDAIAEAGVTSGCNSDGTLYCPADDVTRAQMATFIARALDLDPIGGTGQSARFADVSGTHAPNIEAVAQEGITLGCNSDGTLFCPNDIVNRAQMASFIARGFEFPLVSGFDFTDVNGSHAANISAIAAAGVTLGCNSDGTLYCPASTVRRDQMGSFIARAMGIDPTPYRIKISPDPISFSQQYVGATPASLQTTLKNTGDNAITITATTIGGEAKEDFAITSGGGSATLQPGQERTLWISYDPQATSSGTEVATLTVSTDATDPVVAYLYGSAVSADNLPPTVNNPGELTGEVGDSISLQISASDPDGDDFTFSATGLPDGLTINSSGLISGTLTDSGTSSVIVSADDSFTPGTTQFSWYVSGTAPPAGFDLSLNRFYITQSVPAIDSSQAAIDQTPVVAGRDGLARAFVVASEPNNAAPIVRLFWQSSAGSGTVTLGGPGAVPEAPAESQMADTFAAMLDATAITGDIQVYVMIDPDNTVAESNETNNRYPASGWLDLQAVIVPTLEITLVPITFDGITPDLSDPSEYIEDVLAMMPVAEYDIEVRDTPYVVTAPAFDWATWSATLSEIANLRATDGSTRMYHGIVDPGYSSGIAGIGYIGFPAAVSWSRSGKAGVVAHELGHNFSLDHAPCGVSGDPSFPYAGGKIGVWGYDLESGTQYDPASRFDFMSYCSPVWISDYFYGETLDYRASSGFNIVEPAVGETTLLVTGNVENGVVDLEPLTQMEVAAVTPSPGPYTLIGRDASGQVVLSQSFSAYQAEAPQGAQTPPAGFSFGVPIDRTTLEALVSIEIVSGGETLAIRRASAVTAPSGLTLQAIGDGWTWDTTAYERAVLIDPSTGLVMGYDTTGTIKIDGPLDVMLSDGIRSQTFQLRP